jgi:hypothetical protein
MLKHTHCLSEEASKLWNMFQMEIEDKDEANMIILAPGTERDRLRISNFRTLMKMTAML